MKKPTISPKMQMFLSVFLVIAGVLLIFAAFIVPPLGEIHYSVLTAFGEMLTFAGTVIGIDYHYRRKDEGK